MEFKDITTDETENEYLGVKKINKVKSMKKAQIALAALK